MLFLSIDFIGLKWPISTMWAVLVWSRNDFIATAAMHAVLNMLTYLCQPQSTYTKPNMRLNWIELFVACTTLPVYIWPMRKLHFDRQPNYSAYFDQIEVSKSREFVIEVQNSGYRKCTSVEILVAIVFDRVLVDSQNLYTYPHRQGIVTFF